MPTGETVQSWRRALEVAFWIAIIGFFWTLDTLTKIDERQRTGVGLDDFRLITDQVTSALAVFAMVAFVAFWLRQFPLERTRPLPTLVGHAVGSVLFATGHYTLMVLLRRIVFSVNGLQYMPNQNHWPNLVYEYRKDIKIYLAAVAIIAAYRYFRSQRDAAGVAGELTADPAAKLTVQTAKGELLLDIERIEYLEAARNYVAVHADGGEYLIRSPLSALAERLPDRLFARTHRSYMVNVDEIDEVRSTDGAQQLILKSGARIPVSRGYRDAVKAQLDRIRL